MGVFDAAPIATVQGAVVPPAESRHAVQPPSPAPKVFDELRRREAEERRNLSKPIDAVPLPKSVPKIKASYTQQCLKCGHYFKSLDHHYRCAGMSQSLASYFYHRKKQCRKSNPPVVWELTFDQFKSFSTQKCRYCGVELTSEQFRITRIDPTIGYTIDNVVPCCEEGGRMKRYLNDQDFLNRI